MLVSGPRAALKAVARAPFLVAFLIAGAVFVAVEHDAIVAKWTAIYPSDPARKEALQRCYIENRQFSRLSDEARNACYEKWLPILSFIARAKG
jgi:hypothetical protein